MTSPGVYLRDDPVCGSQMENHSELRAPTAERAAYFLDAAVAARTVSGKYSIDHNHMLQVIICEHITSTKYLSALLKKTL